MAIIPITNDNLEKFKLQTSPKRTLISSSNGLTGSVAVFGRISPAEKDAVPPAGFTNSVFDEETLEEKRKTALKLAQSGKTSYSGALEDYLTAVNNAPQSAVKSKRVEVTRFEPSHKFTKDTMRKNVVKNVLFPRYRPIYDACEWAYPNYHTLNFFTSTKSSKASCLIYPCATGSAHTNDKDNFPYTPGDEFTFEFWINPRYTTVTPTNGPGGTDAEGHYHAGTIMHLSASYCVSLVSGSSVDVDGYPDKFRIMFQLGHAAQTRPHKIGLYNQDALSNTSTNPRKGATLKSNTQFFSTRASVIEEFPTGDTFNEYTKGRGVVALTDDNVLKHNHWHHVAIRGGKSINNRTGSFYVDGKLAGQFPLCSKDYSGNLMPLEMDVTDGDPDALIVGNYLDTRSFEGHEPMLARFFNVNTAFREGLPSFWRDRFDLVAEASGEAAYSDPTAATEFGLDTIISATKISPHATYKIITVGGTAFGEVGAPGGFTAGTVFTAGTFGTNLGGTGTVQKLGQFDFSNQLNAELHEIRVWNEYRSLENIVTGSRSSLTTMSGSLIFYVPPWFTKETRKREVLQTPFQTFRTKTNDPFNAALSFGIGGRELNLPNFTRELVQGVSPRHYHLVSSENAGSTKFMSCNELLYDAERTNINGDLISDVDRGFDSIRKGNLTVLPNDNGLFSPDWSLLANPRTHLGNFGIIPASGSISYTAQPANGNRVRLTSTNGVSHTFKFDNAGTTGTVDLQGVITVRTQGTADLTYRELAKAIRLQTAFGNDMTGSVSSGKLSLRQGLNGEAGNTLIQDAFEKISQTSIANATVSDFTGGENDPATPGTAVDKFVDSFGTQNLGLISLTNMVSTGSIPEGLVDITSEFRGLPGVGAAKATAEIFWTGDVAIADGTKIRLTSHNGKRITFKFLNDSLTTTHPNKSVDPKDDTVVIDARTSVDSEDSGEVGNINDVWFRFMEAVNSYMNGLITVTAPSISPGSTYDNFSADNITSLILTQQIKGTSGNKPIEVTGEFDAAITVPSGFTGGRDNPDASILNSLEGATPEDPGIQPGGILTILNRTRDPSSNEVVFFDASNLFYGNRIKPGSFIVKDSSLTGSGGRVSMTIRDNGKGGLYRADCKSEIATWNEIGAIIYEEGISVIKTPNIPFFGKDQFEVTMQGDHNVHVLEVNIPAPKGKINSSSNPNYKNLIPSDYASETADKFVYITSINLHDENFNIIGRANLAQPIAKRDTDGYMFRLKMDF